MSNTTLSLGRFEHVYKKQGLSLKTNSSIRLLSPQTFLSSFVNNIQSLDSIISSEAWVAAGNRLLFDFHVSFACISVAGSTEADIIEDLGVVLRDAEVLLT